jgi:hypothetical protein
LTALGVQIAVRQKIVGADVAALGAPSASIVAKAKPARLFRAIRPMCATPLAILTFG